MANEITSSVTSADQEKYLAAKLLQRAHLKLVAASICDKVPQPKGTGTQGTFVRYKRMALPTATLTEGVTPGNSAISLETVTTSLDQWGDLVKITDIAKLTTKHPLVQIATDLLSDNAQRLIDREIQIVMVAGTNVQYGDGSVTTRATVTTAMTVTDKTLHKARITMENNGAPPRSGPSNMKENASGGALSGTLRSGSHYVAVCGPEIVSDIQVMAAASGMWSSVTQYNNAKAVYNAEVGEYLGFRLVMTNFIPRFRRLGNATVAANFGANHGTINDAGGITGLTLVHSSAGLLDSAGTYGWKLTRKDLTRGFEEDISIIHTTAFNGAAADNERIAFTMPATAGYTYSLYFDSVAAGGSSTDALLKLVSSGIAAGATVNVDDAQAAGAAPPGSPNATGPVDTVYPVFIIADQALAWVGLQNLKTYVTGEGADKTDPLGQFSTIGYKFMGKATILDQQRLLRLELASNF